MAQLVKPRKCLAILALGFFQICATAHGGIVSCGGVLDGANGTAEFTLNTLAITPKHSNCIWIVQSSKGTAIKFKLNDIANGTSILLHSYENEEPIILSMANISSAVTAPGRQIIAILPFKLGTKVLFEWEAVQDDEDETEEGVIYSGYFTSSHSNYTAEPIGNAQGTFVVGVSLEVGCSLELNYTHEFRGSQLADDCVSTNIYQVLSTGHLNKLRSLGCNAYVEGSWTLLNPEFVAWGKYHVAEGTRAEFSFDWRGTEPGSTTETLRTTTATQGSPGFATTINASKFILAGGLLLQTAAVARVSML